MTTGASNDLSRASELARKLVKEYGMSSLGLIAFGEKEEMVFKLYIYNFIKKSKVSLM
jgi:cell division protease FtsH